MPHIIEAFVRRSPTEPYYKMSFIDESNNVDLHMQHLVQQGYSVTSIKASDADERTLAEFATDLDGNMPIVDNAAVMPPIETEGSLDAVENGVAIEDTGRTG